MPSHVLNVGAWAKVLYSFLLLETKTFYPRADADRNPKTHWLVIRPRRAPSHMYQSQPCHRKTRGCPSARRCTLELCLSAKQGKEALQEVSKGPQEAT